MSWKTQPARDRLALDDKLNGQGGRQNKTIKGRAKLTQINKRGPPLPWRPYKNANAISAFDFNVKHKSKKSIKREKQ